MHPEIDANGSPSDSATTVHHRHVEVDGVHVFYREAGAAHAPAIVLLHGFGASSHMFRALIPQLARHYRVLAPDLPGFGQTTVLESSAFPYTFDRLAEVVDAFTVAQGLDRFALYVFDYGAPVGWRLAVKHPGKITAIVTQNGNGYEAGLSDAWSEVRAAWAAPGAANREALRKYNSLEMLQWQYLQGVPDVSRIAPESCQLAYAATQRIGVEVQMDLLLDYGNNLAQYAQLHAYLRQHQPPLLAIWGRHDPFFLPAGAEAFQDDVPGAQVHLLDTGHFALETHGEEVAARMLDFLHRHLSAAYLDVTGSRRTQGPS